MLRHVAVADDRVVEHLRDRNDDEPEDGVRVLQQRV